MSAYDFSGLSNTTTWSDASFAQDTTNYNQGQIVSQTSNGSLHAYCSPTTGFGGSRAKLVGLTWGNVMTAMITIVGIRSFAVTDDFTQVLFAIETGANAWKGYTWQVGNGFQRLGRIDSTTDGYLSDSPNVPIAASTSDTCAQGDTFQITINKSTGVITGLHNGTQITTATDATYSTGLTAGLFAYVTNHGGTGISRFDTTGDSSSTNTTITPPQGSGTVTGNAPIMTSATNTVVSPITAHRGGIIVPERRIFLPPKRRAA